MHPWVVELVVVAVFVLSCAGLVAAWRLGRLAVAAVVLFTLALVAWVGAFLAIATEFHDANNFATCTECGAVHYVAAVAFIAPPLLISLAALAVLLVRGGRWRTRREAARENHA
jgi:predicted ABC-type exoprotein transport system permease subunit